MNTDCAFYIGSTHEICQDFCLNNNNSNSIVISDGCSGSPNSDIGSRVLSITAMNKLQELDSLYDFDEKECILLARPVIKMLNMPNECLDATLLASKTYPDDSAMTICCGDGTTVIGTKEGETIILDCAYTDSYPFYMNYLYDRTDRYKNWTEYHNNRVITQTVLGVNKEIISTTIISKSTRLFGNLGVIKILDTKMIIEMFDIKKLIENVSIMSDGVHSFYETIATETSRYNKSVSYIEVIKELINFKNYNNSFVQRRVNKFRKDCKKKHWDNSDDMSLGCIYVGE